MDTLSEKKLIVYEGYSKNNNKFIIRYPKTEDAKIMCDYINILSKEKTFIRFQGESISLESETKFLQDQLEKIKKKTAVMLLVFYGNKLIGISGIDMKDRIEGHEGSLGISILDGFRNEGIGKVLMQSILTEAEKNIKYLRIITLGVFANNTVAEKMYKSFGFKEYGRLPAGIHYKGGYLDHIYMFKSILPNKTAL